MDGESGTLNSTSKRCIDRRCLSKISCFFVCGKLNNAFCTRFVGTLFSLLDVSEDRESEVRNAALNALITIGKQHFIATAAILLQYRAKHKAAVGEHARSAVWSSLASVVTSKTDLKSDLGIDVFNDLLTAAAEDVNRERVSAVR